MITPNQILQQGESVARGSLRLSARATTEAIGLLRRRVPWLQTPKPDMDDHTLAQKVQSEVFRRSRALKASVNVNVVDGVVWLRGEVKRPEQIRALESKVRAIPEVKGVENLLHLPKTPAPTRADTPRRQQRTRSSTRRPKPRTQTIGRITDDRTDAIERGIVEPSPLEHEEKHLGRTPAPFGSEGEGSQASSSAETGGNSSSDASSGTSDSPTPPADQAG